MPGTTSESVEGGTRPPRERILDAAEFCFWELGVPEASLRRIAEQAGVSKSLVLYHFESKERLFVAVQIRIYERLAVRVKDLVRSGTTAAQRGLLGLDELFASCLEQNDFAAHVMFCAQALSDARLRLEVAQMRADLHRLLTDTIAEIIDDEHALPVSYEVAADVLTAMLSGLGMQAALGDPPKRLEGARSGLRTLIASALQQASTNGASA